MEVVCVELTYDRWVPTVRHHPSSLVYISKTVVACCPTTTTPSAAIPATFLVLAFGVAL